MSTRAARYNVRMDPVLCSSRHKNIEGTNHTYPAR